MHTGQFAVNYVKDLNKLNIRWNLKAKLEFTQIYYPFETNLFYRATISHSFQNGNAEQQQNNCKEFDSKKLLGHFVQKKTSPSWCVKLYRICTIIWDIKIEKGN